MAIPRLLVSVRDAAEAEAALAGGADLIDVKEPSRGPLGRADAEVMAAVVKAVAGRVPVSAALGELCDYQSSSGTDVPAGVTYIKWGLAGLLGTNWVSRLFPPALQMSDREVVAVAYADWLRAEAPRVAEVVERTGLAPWRTVLVDTFSKDGSTLLTYLSVDQVRALVTTCREHKVSVALAGSLGLAEITRLRDAAPDWFAVRGAACAGGREGRVEEGRVRHLKDVMSAES